MLHGQHFLSSAIDVAIYKNNAKSIVGDKSVAHVIGYITVFLCAIPAMCYSRIRLEKKYFFEHHHSKKAFFVHVLFPQRAQKLNFGCGNSTKKYGNSF